MAVKVIRRWCRDCWQYRPHEKQRANHVLHLILSVCTLGAWIVVWFLVAALQGLKPYRCRECGKARLF